MTTKKSDWYNVIKNTLPKLTHENILKISDYCVQHSDIDFRNVTQDNSNLAEAIQTLHKLLEAKLNFEITKVSQKPVVIKIAVPHEYLELPQHTLKDTLTSLIISTTAEEIKKRMIENKSEQILIWQLYSSVMTVDSNKGKEIHITHNFI